MKTRILRLISTLLVLVMLVEVVPANLLGGWILRASAAEVPANLGFTGLPQPEPLPTTADVEAPPTIIIGEDKPSANAVPELEAELQLQAELRAQEELVAPASSSVEEDTEEEETTEEEVTGPGFDAPYTFDAGTKELVNLNTGELTYMATDYVLPGVNGLDLVIGRVYSSRYANRYHIDSSGNVTELAEADKSVLGQGWHFAFSSMFTLMKENNTASDRYVRLADGTTLRVKSSAGPMWTLEGYAPNVNKQMQCSNSDGVPSYTLSYNDGRKDIFDAQGRLTKMQDAFGNEISFAYDTLNGYERITITDTLNRTVVISSADDADGNVVTTVSLPESISLSYETLQQTSPFSYGALASYTDAVGQVEQYSYTMSQGAYSSLIDDKDYFVNLTTITHPTGATTNYVYNKNTKWAYKTEFSREFYKVATRYDVIGNSILNRKIYLYSSTDSSGYPNTNLGNGYTYTVTIRNIRGLQDVYEFGYTSSGDATYKNTVIYSNKTLYEQEGDGGYTVSPTWKKYYNQTDESVTFSTKAYAITRDEYGNILTEHVKNVGSSASGTQLQNNTYSQNLLTQGILCLDPSNTLKTKNTVGYSNSKVTATELLLNNQRQSYTRFIYDEDTGNLLQELRCINPNQSLESNREYITTTYEYQDDAYLSKVTQTGILTADGEAAEGTPGYDAGTIVTTYGYDTLGRMTSMTDGNGHTTTYAYDDLGNLIQTTNPDQTTIQYARNYAENTLTVTDENGAQTKYTYTALGLLQDTIDVQTGNILSRREYNGLSWLTKVTDYVYGSVTEYTYDGYGNVASETVKQGSTILAQTNYTYNEVTADGQYLKNTKTILGGEGAPSIVTTEYLDAYGNVAKTGRIINGVEYFDTYEYNYQGEVLEVLSAADSAKGLSFTEKYEYNYDGQVKKVYNADNQVITNTYDYLGRLTQTTDYSGTPTTYGYDVLDRLLTQIVTVEEDKTVTTKYDYDPVGNLTRESWPVRGYNDNVTFWSKREYVYGNRNERLQTVELYDWDALAATTTYTYDGVGNMTSMTTHGKTTSYAYDRYGNVISMTDPLNQTETYSYNALGKIVSRTDRNNQTTTYGYDAMGRLVSEIVGTDYRQYTYALTGQVATERNNWYLTSYGYDDAGRMTSITEAEQMAAGGSTSGLLSYTKAYSYDTNNNRTGFTLTYGGTAIQTVGYTYDNLNRLSTVSEDGTVQATYTYDTDGNRASLTYANGVVETYTYNEANWVTGVYNKRGSTVLSSYEYTYYPSGNQSTKTDHTGKRTSYVYDGLGRLEQESDTSGLSIDYFYDAAQNRSSLSYTDGTESYDIYYTYNANNQLTQERKRQDGVYTTIGTYTYDGNGNQLTKTGADGTQTYTYNGFNQQTGFAFGTVTASYAYNTSGIRTSKAINGARTSYLLDGGYVAAELQAGATTPKTYLWGSNLIRREDGSDTSYYLYNAHGDVVNLTNTTGTVTKTYDYSAFGIEQNQNTTDNNPFRYCGEYYDAETGTYYLRARYYNPSLGRFTQADSIQYVLRDLPSGSSVLDPLSLNLYTYCTNNPNTYRDPSGHMAVRILNFIASMYNQGVFDDRLVSTAALILNGGNPYTAFHEIAQIHVAKYLYGEGKDPVLEYKLKGIGEVDIVAGGYAWEVKPITKSGGKQLRKYTEGSHLTEGYYIPVIENIPIVGKYMMRIKTSTWEDGVVQYSFYYTDEYGKEERVPSSVVKEKYKQKQTSATLLVAIPALLTLAETIASYGTGGSNDLPTIIIALKAASEVLEAA